jgi:hypothetical protein
VKHINKLCGHKAGILLLNNAENIDRYLRALERQTDTHRSTVIIRFLYYSYIHYSINASGPKNGLNNM